MKVVIKMKVSLDKKSFGFRSFSIINEVDYDTIKNELNESFLSDGFHKISSNDGVYHYFYIDVNKYLFDLEINDSLRTQLLIFLREREIDKLTT